MSKVRTDNSVITARKLAAANESRVSIRVTKILASCFAGGMVDPVEIFLSSGLITMQNFVAVCYTVWLTSALLRSGTQTRPQVVQLLPSPRPFTPQRGESCRPTLPIGTSADGRHTHIQHTH